MFVLLEISKKWVYLFYAGTSYYSYHEIKNIILFVHVTRQGYTI